MNRALLLSIASASALGALVFACSSNDSNPPPPSSDGGASPADASPAADSGGPSTEDAGAGDAGDGAAEETLDTSFVFVGCNRIQKGDWDAAADPSSANVAQLTQTFADVAAMSRRPKHFFFGGDLVLALVPGTTDLQSQLTAWSALVAQDPSQITSKTDLVPFVGNHELLVKSTNDAGAKLETQNTAADPIWTQWIAANHFDGHAGNGPTNAPPNDDALADDQSRLTYSFDDGDVHYVVLDTDTWTTTADPSSGSTQVGWIALHWLQSDLAAAEANAQIKHVFVFGHKPIVSPIPGAGSLDAINAQLTAPLEQLLDGSTKVRAYLCAHAHEWDARKLPGSRGVYQIVAGNGGSQLEMTWTMTTTPYYGFTEARVYSSGRVGVVSWRRPVPTPYTAATAAATAQPEITITP